MHRAILVTVCLAFSSTGAAQDVQAVPGVTLEMLAGEIVAADPAARFYVGSVPDRVADILPFFEGSLLYGALEGTYVTNVALRVPGVGAMHEVHEDIIRVEAEFGAQLTDHGWSPAGGGTPMSPFVAFRQDAAAVRINAYCHDATGRSLSFFLRPSGPGELTMRLMLPEAPAADYCPHVMTPASAVPSLRLPEGVSIHGMGSSSSGDSFSSSADLTTALPRSELAESLTQQLEEAGWSKGERGEVGSYVLQSFTIPDVGDGVWIGLLLVAGQDEGTLRTLAIRGDRMVSASEGADREAVKVEYETQAVVLQSPAATAVVEFTEVIEEGAAYRYRLLVHASGEETTGEGEVFERYEREERGDGATLTDVGGQLHIVADRLRVEWSKASTDSGWVYPGAGRSAIRVYVVERERFDALDLAAPHER